MLTLTCLRAHDCKYRESLATLKKSKILIICLENPCREIHSKKYLQETKKSLQETIAGLEEANAMLRKQLDNLEQYTPRTNIRIFGIPEPTGTDPEDTDAEAIDFFANQLGITVSSGHISRSH